MPRPTLLGVTAGGLMVALLTGGAIWGLRGSHVVETPVATAAVSRAGVSELRQEAIRLYADGQFPLACDHFHRAADGDPTSTALRQDLARCFEGWGWQTLRGGRPHEATLLFRIGLRSIPDDPGLLRGLGVASIHEGRVQEAVGPLERLAERGDADAEVQVLLARLYHQRDEPESAVRHLRAVLQRTPEHPAARELLDKVEREHHVEGHFDRLATAHFVIKGRRGQHIIARRALLTSLDAAWERVGAELGYRPAERLTVVLYADEEFRAVAGLHSWVSGLFDGKIRLPLSGTPPASTLERLVTHEYAHAAIHELSRGRAPRWLHEGLAQFLEGASADPTLRVPGHLTLVGLEALVSDADPVRARAGYRIALWVTEDLARRGGLSGLRALLDRLGAGDSVAAAMVRVYGLRAAELESQWRNLLGS
jgi:tetratricopeptide (TPR) repeat protein